MNDKTQHPDDFANRYKAASAELQARVEAACAAETEWPARVAAAIRAALAFAAAEPTAARLLVVDALGVRVRRHPYVRLIERYAALLRIGAPPQSRQPLLTEQALVGGIVTIAAEELRGGRPEALEGLAPELVEFTLLPYLGRQQARRWGRG
jgi:hypothetical protein